MQPEQPAITKPTAPRNVKTALRYAAMAVLTVGPLAYVGYQVADGWPALAERSWHLSWPYLGLSCGLLLLNFLLVSWTWAQTFQSLHPGTRVPLRHTFAIIYTAQLGRYIPGKIWIWLGQAYLAERFGYRKADALTAGAIQIICGNAASAAVFGLTLWGMGQPLWLCFLMIAISLGVMAALLVAPARLEGWYNTRRLKQGKDPVRLVASPPAMIKVYFIMTLAWAEHCLAFAALAWAVLPAGGDDFFELATAYNLAYHVGLFLLIVPGGLGVREGTLTALLAPRLGEAPAGMLALVQRLWFLVGEAAAFGLAWLIAYREGVLAGKRSDPL
ncbi:MAG: hypothetical protein GX444_06435 [Myxococcales bacterium]|nr:hypothetical protein [Myxococcales bacterium]